MVGAPSSDDDESTSYLRESKAGGDSESDDESEYLRSKAGGDSESDDESDGSPKGKHKRLCSNGCEKYSREFCLRESFTGRNSRQSFHANSCSTISLDLGGNHLHENFRRK